ncbi:MAG: hypothetical protein Q8M03_08215 [Legionella sp.]|nr:hypothetical protein [Legionella sp.]
MEIDKERYQHNSKLFITSLICLVLSLCFFSFALYILPNLLWDWDYDIPEFVFTWRQGFVDHYNFGVGSAKITVFLIFFIPALITGYISYITSNKIENEVLGIVPPKLPGEAEPSQEVKETLSFSVRLLLTVLLVLVVLFFVEWLLKTPPQELI